jgi:hypothetical protein
MRAGLGRPVLFAALAAAVATGSCRMSDHRARIETNVTLLSQLSDKLADYCRAGFELDGRELTSEEMGEFYYALKRARLHAPQPGGAEADLVDKEYEEFLIAYENFVRAADQYRLSRERNAAALDSLMREHANLRRLADGLLALLRSSRRSRRTNQAGAPAGAPAIELSVKKIA